MYAPACTYIGACSSTGSSQICMCEVVLDGRRI